MFGRESGVVRGFSMIELVLVVVIIGMVTAIAMPKFAHAGSGRRLSAAQKTLLADIETAKLMARVSSKPHLIKFYPAQNIYIIVEGLKIKRSKIVLSREFDPEPYRLGISRTSLGINQYATITPYGDASPGFSVGLIDEGTEITVVIDGIADVALTVVDQIVDIQADLKLLQ